MRFSSFTFAFIFSLLTPTIASADANGAKVLAAVDKLAETFEDQSYRAKMQIRRDGKTSKKLEFEMTMKGLHKQYIVFKAPGDVAGMKILMTDPDSIWMYSPEFKKVRKIAAHAQKQGFLGSEFSAEDMVMAKLSGRFDAKIKGREGTITTLELSPKTGQPSRYSRLEIEIDKKRGGVTRIRYFDQGGVEVREQRREGWKKVAGKPFPTRISMKNLKTGAETVIELTDIRVDQGVEDSLFSRRTLLRG